ncbi:MAG TPA: nitronate monooxygenase, partial [Acidimicrobiales bacterium]|nr:nitronate monooxygenase [Acidimicrobiales bacterium]
MEGLLGELGITNPVIAAPMAGGPTTPELVVAAARAGSLGFLAAGYKTTEELARQIEIVRSGTATFGVNLFVPTPVPVDVPAYRRYAAALQPDADLYGLDLADTSIREDDDWFGHKVDLVVGEGVRVVSFTFGVVGPEVVTRLRRSGAIVVQTVTS